MGMTQVPSGAICGCTQYTVHLVVHWIIVSVVPDIYSKCECTLVVTHHHTFRPCMAKFTAQGGLKLHFNGDSGSFAFDSSDPFNFRLGKLRFLHTPAQIHRNKVRTPGSGRVVSASKKSSTSKAAEEHLNDDYDEDDYEKDELSCFRGLVLDISYRSLIFWFAFSLSKEIAIYTIYLIDTYILLPLVLGVLDRTYK